VSPAAQPPKWVPPKTTKKNGGPVATQPLVQNPPPVPAPATIEDAKALPGFGEGTPITAPMSAKTGPLSGAAGSLVVTVVKDFWKSPTIIGIKNAVLAAVGIALFGVAMQVVSVNGDLSKIDLQTTQKLFIGAVAFSLASAYAAWWKRRDNDPVKQG
jgi:hypothetical protein